MLRWFIRFGLLRFGYCLGGRLWRRAFFRPTRRLGLRAFIVRLFTWRRVEYVFCLCTLHFLTFALAREFVGCLPLHPQWLFCPWCVAVIFGINVNYPLLAFSLRTRLWGSIRSGGRRLDLNNLNVLWNIRNWTWTFSWSAGLWTSLRRSTSLRG